MAKTKIKKKSARKYSKRSGSSPSISIISILVGLGLAFLILIGLNIKHSLNQSGNISAESSPSSTQIQIPTPKYTPNTGS